MTIISPTPERSQHDDLVIQRGGRKNAARVYVLPIYDRWHSKGIIDDRQRSAAQTYVEDSESMSRGVKSSLASLDRIDFASAGLVEGDYLTEAIARLAAVQRALGPHTEALVRRVLVHGVSPEEATGKHKHVARGMIVMALEVMAVTLGK